MKLLLKIYNCGIILQSLTTHKSKDYIVQTGSLTLLLYQSVLNLGHLFRGNIFLLLKYYAMGSFDTLRKIALIKASCLDIEVSSAPSVKIGLSQISKEPEARIPGTDTWMFMSAEEKNNTSIFKLVGILNSNHLVECLPQ